MEQVEQDAYARLVGKLAEFKIVEERKREEERVAEENRKRLLKSATEMQVTNDEFDKSAKKARTVQMLQMLFEKKYPAFLGGCIDYCTKLVEERKEYTSKGRIDISASGSPMFDTKMSHASAPLLMVNADSRYYDFQFLDDFLKKYDGKGFEYLEGAYINTGSFYLKGTFEELIAIGKEALKEIENEKKALYGEVYDRGITYEELLNFESAEYLHGGKNEVTFVDPDTGYIRGVKENATLIEDHRPKPKR